MSGSPTNTSPVTIVTRSLEECAKAKTFGYESAVWKTGLEQTLTGQTVVTTFELPVTTLLPVVLSLKTVAGLPDSLAGLTDAISAAPERRKRLVVIPGDIFLDEIIPPREVLLETTKKSPIFYAQSLNQIWGWRGAGKTNVALGVTGAIATGGQIFNWKATRPARVLYVEGELPAYQMQERVRQLVGKTNGNLRVITLDKQLGYEIPSLVSPFGQKLIEEAIGDSEVLVLDSISTLFNFGTNEEDPWLTIQNWSKKLRAKGMCVIFLQHAGKNGSQRGHSKSEDALDVSVKLSHPTDYKITDGLRLVVEFDKTRGVCMLDGGSIEVQMTIENDSAIWTYSATEDALYRSACQMFDEGMSVRDVAEALGKSSGLAGKWRKRWNEPKDMVESDDVFTIQ